MVLRLVGGALLVAVAVLGGAGQGGFGAKWWESAEVKAKLGLTDDQARRIDQIYNDALPERVKGAEIAARLGAELDTLLWLPDSTEQQIAELADRAGAAQALRARSRTLVLYRMYRVLTPAQRKQMEQIAAHRRRSGSNAPRPPDR